MKRILAVIALVCALLTGCKQTKPPETTAGTSATEQVLEESVDYSQLETVGPVSPEVPTAPSQVTAPTHGAENTTPPQTATTPTPTEPTAGSTTQPTEPVPPATDPDGYFNQVVRP